LNFFDALTFLAAYRYLSIRTGILLLNAPRQTQHMQKTQLWCKKNKNIVREELDPIFFGKDSYLETMLDKVSRQFGVPPEDIQWYTTDEL